MYQELLSAEEIEYLLIIQGFIKNMYIIYFPIEINGFIIPVTLSKQ